MFKKLLIASAVLAASSTVAFAGHAYKGDYKGEAAPCPSYSFLAGPYVGLSVGVRDNYSGTPTFYKGIEGTLSAGYGMMFDPSWYLAGEVFGGDSANVKNYGEENAPHNTVRSTWNAGFSVIPGYMVTDHVLGYVRVGGIWTGFHSNGGSSSNERTHGAWQVGLGAQTNIYQNWDVRGEYVYSGYGSRRSVGKVGADQVNFGVVYKFV